MQSVAGPGMQTKMALLSQSYGLSCGASNFGAVRK